LNRLQKSQKGDRGTLTNQMRPQWKVLGTTANRSKKNQGEETELKGIPEHGEAGREKKGNLVLPVDKKKLTATKGGCGVGKSFLKGTKGKVGLKWGSEAKSRKLRQKGGQSGGGSRWWAWMEQDLRGTCRPMGGVKKRGENAESSSFS